MKKQNRILKIKSFPFGVTLFMVLVFVYFRVFFDEKLNWVFIFITIGISIGFDLYRKQKFPEFLIDNKKVKIVKWKLNKGNDITEFNLSDITLAQYWNQIKNPKYLVFKLQNGLESRINLEIGGKKLTKIISLLSQQEINYELNCNEDERRKIIQAIEKTA